MKKILVTFLSIFMAVVASYSQSDIQTYTQKYEKGERNKAFLKEYVTMLMNNKNISLLEKVADTYLMTIPINERYKGFNLEVFNNGIKEYDDLSFRDFMKKWNKIVNKDNIDLFQKKIKMIYSLSLFNYTYKKQNSSEDFRSRMSEDVKRLEANYYNLYLLLLSLRYSVEVLDYKAINQNIKELMTNYDSKMYSNWNEMSVISSALSMVVDNGDMDVSKELLEILTPYRGKLKWINSISEGIEGKILMLQK